MSKFGWENEGGIAGDLLSAREEVSEGAASSRLCASRGLRQQDPEHEREQEQAASDQIQRAPSESGQHS
ncbi:MAG: hypothetical protein U0Q16_35060 [Bryobacteraceae bacterium]